MVNFIKCFMYKICLSPYLYNHYILRMKSLVTGNLQLQY